MKNTSKETHNRPSGTSQPKHLSFYEENYLLEPEEYAKDNGYFDYESAEASDPVYLNDTYRLAI